jgi:hypothetical protein
MGGERREEEGAVERYPRLQKVWRMLVVLDQVLKNKQSVGVPRE